MWEELNTVATAGGTLVATVVAIWGFGRARRNANARAFADLKRDLKEQLGEQTIQFNLKLASFARDCEVSSENVLTNVQKLDRDLEDIRKQVRAFEGETADRFADKEDLKDVRGAIRVLDGKLDSINEYLRQPRRVS